MSEPTQKCEKFCFEAKLYSLICFKMAYYSCFSLREIWIFLISSKKSLIKSTIDYWIRIRREIIHFLQSPVTNVCIEVLQDIFPQDFVLHRFFSFFPLSLSPYSSKAQVQIELINEIFFTGSSTKKLGFTNVTKIKIGMVIGGASKLSKDSWSRSILLLRCLLFSNCVCLKMDKHLEKKIASSDFSMQHPKSINALCHK